MGTVVTVLNWKSAVVVWKLADAASSLARTFCKSSAAKAARAGSTASSKDKAKKSFLTNIDSFLRGSSARARRRSAV
jgi:hypothetical protein